MNHMLRHCNCMSGGVGNSLNPSSSHHLSSLCFPCAMTTTGGTTCNDLPNKNGKRESFFERPPWGASVNKPGGDFFISFSSAEAESKYFFHPATLISGVVPPFDQLPRPTSTLAQTDTCPTVPTVVCLDPRRPRPRSYRRTDRSSPCGAAVRHFATQTTVATMPTTMMMSRVGRRTRATSHRSSKPRASPGRENWPPEARSNAAHGADREADASPRVRLRR